MKKLKLKCLKLQVLETLPLGAGMLSEEGAEATNKVFRYNRAHHARKSDVDLNLLDVFRRSHHISHPSVQQILSKTLLPKRSHKPLTNKAKALLALPETLLQPPPQKKE